MMDKNGSFGGVKSKSKVINKINTLNMSVWSHGVVDQLIVVEGEVKVMVQV